MVLLPIPLLRRSLGTAATAASLRRASKVVCVGRNYADHISELQSARPKQPFFFLKPPSSILLPGEGPVLRPRGVDLHYEVELALVMGRTVKDLDPDDEQAALDAIDCYAVAIDMTGRNVQNEAKDKGLPWAAAKGFDTFLPLGPAVPKSAVPDPHNAELRLAVNGHTRQAASTGLMLFRIPRLLAAASRVMTLVAGDLVLTGTPAGVGSVAPGDVMRAGLVVGGREVEGATIEVGVEEARGAYDFTET